MQVHVPEEERMMAKQTKAMTAAMLVGAQNAADAFMALKAAQSELAVKEKNLKAIMLSSGLSFVDGMIEIEGQIARVTISQCDGKTSVNMDLLRKMLTPAALKRVLKTGAPSLRFAAKARVADAKVMEAA
jgi:hypothetical protein